MPKLINYWTSIDYQKQAYEVCSGEHDAENTESFVFTSDLNPSNCGTESGD